MDYYDTPSQESNSQNNEMNGRRPDANRTNMMAVASFLCGLFGLLSLCCCIAFPLSILLGVAAITLAILSRRGEPFSGYAIAGLVLGILSVVFGIMAFAYLMIANQIITDPQMAPIFDELMEEYQSL